MLFDGGDERIYIFHRRIALDDVRGRAHVAAATAQDSDLALDVGFDLFGRAKG